MFPQAEGGIFLVIALLGLKRRVFCDGAAKLSSESLNKALLHGRI